MSLLETTTLRIPYALMLRRKILLVLHQLPILTKILSSPKMTRTHNCQFLETRIMMTMTPIQTL